MRRRPDTFESESDLPRRIRPFLYIIRRLCSEQETLYHRNLEEFSRIFEKAFLHRLSIFMSDARNFPYNLTNIERFVSLSSIGYRSDIRTVGLRQNPVKRQVTNDFIVTSCKGNHAREGKKETGVEKRLGFINRAGEKVEIAAWP